MLPSSEIGHGEGCNPACIKIQSRKGICTVQQSDLACGYHAGTGDVCCEVDRVTRLDGIRADAKRDRRGILA